MNEEQVFFSNKKFKSSFIGLNHNSITKIRKNLILIFLFIYWIAVIASFFLYHREQDVLTKMSNYLQLILNTSTLTVALINPIFTN